MIAVFVFAVFIAFLIVFVRLGEIESQTKSMNDEIEYNSFWVEHFKKK